MNVWESTKNVYIVTDRQGRIYYVFDNLTAAKKYVMWTINGDLKIKEWKLISEWKEI